MAAKIFILAFAAVIWQAQSQNCGQAGNLQSLSEGCSAPQKLCAALSSPIQLAIPISGDGCISLNLETLGLQASVIPSPPATSANLCCEESSLLCRPRQSVDRPQINFNIPVVEEICRPLGAKECSNLPKPPSVLRPLLPNFRSICTLDGLLDNIPSAADISAFTRSASEAKPCVGPVNQITPKLPNSIIEINRINLNPFLGQNNLDNSAIFDSSMNFKPCKPVSNSVGINNVTPNIQTTTTTETTTIFNNVGAFGGNNNQGNSITATSNAEASTSVNVRPESYTPSAFRGFNNQPRTMSSAATSEATTFVSNLPNIFRTNVIPAQTNVATAESAAVSTSNAGSSRVFSPGTVSTAATSETTTSVSNPGIYSSNIFKNNLTPTHTSVATAESTTITESSVSPSRIFTPGTVSSVASSEATTSVSNPVIYSSNMFGNNVNPAQINVATTEATAVTRSNVGPSSVFTPGTVSSVATSEATSSVSNPGIYFNTFGTNVTPTQASVATAESAAITKSNVGSSGVFIPVRVSSVATSEATSSMSNPEINSSNIYRNNITPPQTSAATAESTTVTNSNVGPSRVLVPGTVSSFATSEATSSVSDPGIYSFDIFGSNVTPSQTSVATAESTAVSKSNIDLSRGFTPGTVSSVAASEAMSPVSNPGICSPYIFRTNFIPAQTNVATAESTALTTSVDSSVTTSEATTSVRNPGIIYYPDICETNVTPTQTNVALAESTLVTTSNIGPSFTPGTVSSAATSEATTSVSNPVLCFPNIFGSITPAQTVFNPNYFSEYNVAQPTVSSVACSEASSSANIGLPAYGGSTSTATASSESVSSTRPINSHFSCTYQPDAATLVTTSNATSSAVVGSGFGSNIYGITSCNPLPVSSTAPSEAVTSTKVPHSYSPCIFRNSNNFDVSSSASASAGADACSSVNIDSSNMWYPSVAISSDAEATSTASIGSSNIPGPFNPWVSNDCNNVASPVKAAVTTESSSAKDIVPLSSVAPNFFGGIFTACLSEPAIGPAYLETPLFYPNSCSRTRVNSIPPQVYGYDLVPCISVFEFSQPSFVSSLNPIATNLRLPIYGGAGPVYSLVQSLSTAESNAGPLDYEASSSTAAIAKSDESTATSSSVTTAEASTSTFSTTSEPQGVKTSTLASSSSSSTTVTDTNNPCTPCNDEVISSSSVSSSSTTITEPVISSVATSASTTTSSSSVSSISSPLISYQNPCNIELPPVALEVQIPSSVATSSSSSLYGCSSGLPTMSISTPPIVYELQIPSSIPAQLSCTLESVPSTILYCV